MAPAMMIDLTVRPTKVDRAERRHGPRRHRRARERCWPAGRRGRGAWNRSSASATRKMQMLDAGTAVHGRSDRRHARRGRAGAGALRLREDAPTSPTASAIRRALDPDRRPATSSARPASSPRPSTQGDARVPQDRIGHEDGRSTATPARARSRWAATTTTAATRATGEMQDFRAGRCMGACLEYAARRGVPLMLYVFCDGSLSRTAWSTTRSTVAASSVDERQPADRGVVLPRLQPDGPAGAARHGRRRHGAAPADRLLPAGRLRRDGLEPGCECREPARRDRGAQLHGPAR